MFEKFVQNYIATVSSTTLLAVITWVENLNSYLKFGSTIAAIIVAMLAGWHYVETALNKRAERRRINFDLEKRIEEWEIEKMKRTK